LVKLAASKYRDVNNQFSKIKTYSNEACAYVEGRNEKRIEDGRLGEPGLFFEIETSLF